MIQKYNLLYWVPLREIPTTGDGRGRGLENIVWFLLSSFPFGFLFSTNHDTDIVNIDSLGLCVFSSNWLNQTVNFPLYFIFYRLSPICVHFHQRDSVNTSIHGISYAIAVDSMTFVTCPRRLTTCQ